MKKRILALIGFIIIIACICAGLTGTCPFLYRIMGL